MLGSGTLHYSAMKLVSKMSNLCDDYPPTLGTDRQTTCNRKTALCTIVHLAVQSKFSYQCIEVNINKIVIKILQGSVN